LTPSGRQKAGDGDRENGVEFFLCRNFESSLICTLKSKKNFKSLTFPKKT